MNIIEIAQEVKILLLEHWLLSFNYHQLYVYVLSSSLISLNVSKLLESRVLKVFSIIYFSLAFASSTNPCQFGFIETSTSFV